MTQKRKIVDARADEDGIITHVKLDGNTNFTSVDVAIPMADRGDIDNALNVRCKIGAFPWRFVGGEASICRVVAFILIMVFTC